MGREFIDLFEEWAHHYDDTVSGKDMEYNEVFENYYNILKSVANKSNGFVIEFGVGTGNLTEKLLEKNLSVQGIEPSGQMRLKAESKFPQLKIANGDFLNYNVTFDTVDTIVSSYAFHHLTDDEKDRAIASYSQLLPAGGKIIFADTMYENKTAKEAILQDAKDKGFHNLLHDLETEYYPDKTTMQRLFTAHHFDVTFTQLNRFVWLMEAVKKKKM